MLSPNWERVWRGAGGRFVALFIADVIYGSTPTSAVRAT
jgi:hypothetical protein